jgi:hypothetical protein
MESKAILDLDVEDVSQPIWESLDDELFTIQLNVVYDSCGGTCAACEGCDTCIGRCVG